MRSSLRWLCRTLALGIVLGVVLWFAWIAWGMT